MNILLINPYFLSSPDYSFFPLGLGYISSVLKKHGDKVDILDLNEKKTSDQELEDIIKTGNYAIACYTSVLGSYDCIKKITECIRRISPNTVIAGGGAFASSCPEFIIKTTDTDIIACGEGESTIIKIVEAVSGRKPFEEIEGACFRRISDGKIIKNKKQELIRDLDSIPFPDWHSFNMEAYVTSYVDSFDVIWPVRNINIVLTRGCSGKCIFCNKGIFGSKIRKRSVDNVIQELIYMVYKFKIEAFSIVDDNFVTDKTWLRKFNAALPAAGLNLKWSCNTRVDAVDEETLQLMKSAGCIRIGYGIESGSQDILNALGKNTTVQRNIDIVLKTKELGIIPRIYILIGMFGESKDTVKDTINYCKTVGEYPDIRFLTPLPGTPLYKKAINSGKLDNAEEYLTNWCWWRHDIKCNLTDFNDDELLKLRYDIETGLKQYFNK